MAHGLWLMVHSLWFMAHGSWLMALSNPFSIIQEDGGFGVF
jgi:hypothetical protein